ncbi:MAG: nitroreductase [Candidatus Accumulibacter sp.]|jgi:nitroreductase|nr:nitroreductase [Accumulibacter sp.]
MSANAVSVTASGRPLGAYEALYMRKSIRAYRSSPVPRDSLERILTAAGRAPSGTNTQPWRVRVLTGNARQRLVDAVLAFRMSNPGVENWGYAYYPPKWQEPYSSRRRKVGLDMYGLLGIGKGDTGRMQEQQNRNFCFFDAPVGLVFSIGANMERGSWLDYGFFIQSIALAAVAEGLGSCIQACWVAHSDVVASALDFSPEERLVCCMALGFPDMAAPVNRLETERMSLDELALFFQD